MRTFWLTLSLLLAATSARAQTAPAPSLVAAVDEAIDPELEHLYEEPSVLDARRKRLRRSRAVLTAGAVLLGMGAAQLAAFGPNRCTEGYAPEKPIRSRWLGAMSIGLGFGLTFGGAVSLLTVPREQRRAMPMTERGRAGFRRGVIGSVLTMLAVSLAVGLTELMICGSS